MVCIFLSLVEEPKKQKKQKHSIEKHGPGNDAWGFGVFGEQARWPEGHLDALEV